MVSASLSPPLLAKSSLLDLLGRRSTITREEYLVRKAAQNGKPAVNIDDGFKPSNHGAVPTSDLRLEK